MADDSAPFLEIAKSAGIKLNAALRKDLESATKTDGFLSFPIKRYDDILKDVISRFRTQVGGSIAVCKRLVAQISLTGIWGMARC
jgi:hypothetical protein